jgi:hypothetical protein
LEPDCWAPNEKITEEENTQLIKPFSEDEIKKVIKSMKKNTAPGPDHMPVEFYQSCWEIIKEDFMEMMQEFWGHELDIDRLNYGVITLLPKLKEAAKIQQYRPICLLNVSYKIITKALMLRFEDCMSKIICVSQNVFIKDRNIMDGVLSLHEILHETKRKNKDGVILKLDFEKAYDKISWSFLFDSMKQRGFCDTWCNWIQQVVCSGTLSVKINDTTGSYFKSRKGVRQGDPLSPLLFNLAADCLAKMVHLAQENNLIKGLIPNIIPKGVAILQYADDTILCMDDEVETMTNMKILLYIYEKMSGLKINFGKSEIIMVSLDEQKTLLFSELINCATWSWPIKYLGVPVSGSRLHVKDRMSLNDKILKRLDGWQSTSLSYGGKLILLNACLSCIPTYAMSMYLLPKTVVKKIDIIRKRFFWRGGANKRKYHLVKWAVITKPKKKGGLGVKDLRKMNISLLCKWWWKLENEEGLWQEIVRKKYKVKGGIVNLRNKPSNSPVWNDLIKIKGVYLAGRIMKIGDGRDIDFWRDPWYGRVNLIEKFRDLYDISNEQCVYVADMA